MQSLCSNALCRFTATSLGTSSTCNRYASLTSAIGRGIRQGQWRVERAEKDPRTEAQRDGRATPWQRRKPTGDDTEMRDEYRYNKKEHWGRPDESKTTERQQTFHQRDFAREARNRPEHDRARTGPPNRKVMVRAPPTIPYTTAGSEFLYGTFAVKAALKARRRKMYKLYVWNGVIGEKVEAPDLSLRKLALASGIEVADVGGEWDRILTKMTGNRPHNGYVLETSAIPKLPITTLQAMTQPKDQLGVTLAHQSAEDATINGSFEVVNGHATLPSNRDSKRYPLLLFCDRIVDPGNLGAIIRSAYFLGVDAVILPEHGTAPFSPVTIKSSAGAAEYLPILTVKRVVQFIRASQANGWKFFAAVAPDSGSTWKKQKEHDQTIRTALLTHPCVLMLGHEGEGLRPYLQKAADHHASIEGTKGLEADVESLNVSVAAALLMHRFLLGAGETSQDKLVQDDDADQVEDAEEKKKEAIF